jgi:hypothetical protein
VSRSDVQQPPPFWVPKDAFRYTTEELRIIATQYVTSKEAAELLPVPSSREATPGSSNMAPSAAADQDAKWGTKGDKKRRKRSP